MSETILPLPNYIKIISKVLELKDFQVQVVLDFKEEGATVPFIARYRKERTGNLDENDIRAIMELQTKEENLHKAKQTAINGIEELGKMTPELMANIINAKTLKEVEEIYKPYKSKKKTKAMLAIEKGFQVVADSIKQNILVIPENLLKEFNREEIIDGAIEIIGAEISANTNLRHELIEKFQTLGSVSASKKSEKMLEKLNQKDTEQIPKFALYFEFNSRINRIKPYQILALNRGENLGILNIKLDKDEFIFESIKELYSNILNLNKVFIAELEIGFKTGYEALFSSVENEIRGDLSEIGEDDSILSFQKNLQALLMTKPEYGKIILAVDPGYRAGCKICVIDTIGNPILFDKVYLHEEDNFKLKIKDIIKKYKIDTVVVGNGTGCDESCTLISELFTGEMIVVNESGASVYSASPVAQEEFPDLDSLDRGTVSIGRRYIDPLSELVKVPVGSIGVGMYQHDIAEKKLNEKLGYVVEDVVNEVGINVNNASVYVLNHISGIDKREAKKIYNHRPYKSRATLQKVLSEKAYKLAIGFLRVPESKEVLDNTDIHPDQYEIARYIKDNGINSTNFESHKSRLIELYTDANLDTLDFILEAYKNAGIEKRVNSTHTKAKKKIIMEDIKEGDVFDGVVRNVVAFGAFVDIGLKNDGLVHVSQLADKFVSNPLDIVNVGDRVKVKLIGIDKTSGKIQLSMKDI
ncbi:MAG: Tex-like N-terminal domain-containing protein [Candidatus Gracilibacteria bacterium]|nr:Tex-like N-terminal domain-containing protein [Candidatus Gracilibacteria bacterium]MDD2908776.1 Tex-like N-terminal domain-containing protein [Candidatus Gracilibacteria bacterium]